MSRKITRAFQPTRSLLRSIPYGIQEKDIHESAIYKYPKLYKRFQDNRLLTYQGVFFWLLLGMFQSIVIFVFSYLLFKNDTLLTDGRIVGLETLGLITSSCALIVVLNTMAFDTDYWTWLTQLFHWGSHVIYLILVIILSVLGTNWWPKGYFMFFVVVQSPSFYFILALELVVCLFPMFVVKYNKRQYFSESWQIIQEQERVAARSVDLHDLRIHPEMDGTKTSEESNGMKSKGVANVDTHVTSDASLVEKKRDEDSSSESDSSSSNE